MKTTHKVITLAVAALIPMGAAVANDYDKDKSKQSGASFDTMDTNRDGRISQAEASVDSTIVFSTADTNGDGSLDKSEWHKRSEGSMNPGSQPQPQPQSQPTTPSSDPSASPAGDQSASEPTPDTETPRQ